MTQAFRHFNNDDFKVCPAPCGASDWKIKRMANYPGELRQGIEFTCLKCYSVFSKPQFLKLSSIGEIKEKNKNGKEN